MPHTCIDRSRSPAECARAHAGLPRRRHLLQCLVLQLIVAAWAGKADRRQQHKGRGGRPRLNKSDRPKRVPAALRHQRQQQLTNLPDGFLWRITVADGSQMRLYADSGSITTTLPFFSLFGIRVGAQGEHFLDTFVEYDGTRRLAPLRLHGDALTRNRRVVITPPAKAHIRRKRDRTSESSTPAPSPPPPPPPPPSDELPLYLQKQPDGSYAVLTSSGHISEDRPEQAIIARNRSWGQNDTTYFFERIAPVEPPESSTGGSMQRGFSSRVKRSITRVSGRELVVVTAATLPFIDQTPLAWAWLEANGFSSVMLLSVEMQTCDAALLINRNRPNRSLRINCVTPRDLSLPVAGSAAAWARQKIMLYETAANLAEAKYLGRCKLRLIELLLQQGRDAVFLDPGVLVLSPLYLESLVRMGSDLAVGSACQGGPKARQSGYADGNLGTCVRIPPGYAPWVRDWVGTGQFYLRSSPASLWFVQEAQRLMDQHELADVDAFQVLLTGHVQINDPFRTDRRLERTPKRSGGHSGYSGTSKWLKPVWLELEHDPYKGDRLLAHKWLRPLNAPLSVQSWARLRSEMRLRKFNWTVLPETAFVEDSMAIEADWRSLWGRGLGSMRIDGTRNGKFVSFEMNCQTRHWMADYVHYGSFLLRPEPQEETWAKFEKDFPAVSRSFRKCGRSRCDEGERGGEARGKGGSASGGSRGKRGGGTKSRKKKSKHVKRT